MGDRSLNTAKLAALWTRWHAVGHNSMRFGQYVMSETDYVPPLCEEKEWGIDLFYETDARKCFDFLVSSLQDYR